MSAEPTPTEELPREIEIVTHGMLSERLEMFERRLKADLESARINRQGAEREAFAEIAKREIERANETRDRAEREVRVNRSEKWMDRLQAAAVGFIVTIFFGVCASQCGDMYHRLSILENKQSK